MLEDNLREEEPIRSLAKIESQRRQFYRPIYSLHRYWARRPGVLFRAIALTLFRNEHIFKGAKIDQQIYYQSNDLSKDDLIVIDPFMGGGGSLVELNRLNIKSIGIDINPLSWWITRKELDDWDYKSFLKEVEHFYKDVKAYKPSVSRTKSAETYIIAKNRKILSEKRFDVSLLYNEDE